MEMRSAASDRSTVILGRHSQGPRMVIPDTDSLGSLLDSLTSLPGVPSVDTGRIALFSDSQNSQVALVIPGNGQSSRVIPVAHVSVSTLSALTARLSTRMASLAASEQTMRVPPLVLRTPVRPIVLSRNFQPPPPNDPFLGNPFRSCRCFENGNFCNSTVARQCTSSLYRRLDLPGKHRLGIRTWGGK